LSAQSAAILTAGIAAVGTAIDSLELLVERKRISSLFHWPILQTQYGPLMRSRRMGPVMAAALDGNAIGVLSATRLLAAPLAAILLWRSSPVAVLACAAVCLTGALIRTRLVYGLDGSDQMQAVVWVGLAIYSMAPGTDAGELALLFIGAQLTLSYVAAGVAKLISYEWRSGAAILGILSTESYGHPVLHRLLDTPLRAKVICWSVIAFEVGFPVLAISNEWGLALAIAAAVCFHVGIAMAMGLNGFMWAFPAALPCAAYLFTQIPT
jgi:hypothetical protein